MKAENLKTTIADEVAKCNRCGFCLSACPVYQATGIETKAPRGRNFLARSLTSKDFTWTEDVKKSLFQCLGCRACVEACFPAVETDKVVVAMRADYYHDFGEPWMQRYLFRKLLPDPQKLSAAIKKAPWLKAGASMVRAIKFLPWSNRDLLRAMDLLPPLPDRTLREQWTVFAGKQKGKAKKVAYFGGCAFNFAMPQIGMATLELLSREDFQVLWPEHGCCGLPAYGHGDLEGARIMARKNLEIFQNLDTEAVVSECASCSSFLKKYPVLLAEEPRYAELAQHFSSRVKDFSEFLLPLTLSLPRSLTADTVTFHDPCHLHRFQKIKNQPRELLKKVPGLRLVEMAEADWCCGGGAGLNLAHYDISMKILERKMGNANKTKAQILITSCPGCLLQLRHGAKINGVEIEVRYLTEFLAGSPKTN